MTENVVIREGSASVPLAIAGATVGFVVFGGIAAAFFCLPDHLQWESWLFGAIAGLVALAMYPLAILSARRRRYVLTEKTAMYRKGIISRFEVEVLYSRAQAVTMRQSILQRIFGCGDVIISVMGVSPAQFVTGQDTNSVCIRSIPDFEEVAGIVREKMGK